MNQDPPSPPSSHEGELDTCSAGCWKFRSNCLRIRKRKKLNKRQLEKGIEKLKIYKV